MFVRRSKVLFHITRTLVVLLFLMISNFTYSSAQQSYLWSAQQKIPEYEINNNEQPPYLVADKNHTVHAFNSQLIGDRDSIDSYKAVFYRQWTLANGWTFPNDIIADLDSDLHVLGVSSDESGKVHLVFQRNTDLYYSQAYLANASDSKSWSLPVAIGEQSLPVRDGIPNIAAITNDRVGEKITVIYSGTQDGNGLYFIYSMDYGSTWSAPYPIYLTSDETLVVTDPSLYMGQSGIVHGVWSTFDREGFGAFGYYASFDSNLVGWSEPIELDQPGIRTPSVVEYKESIFVGYYHHSTNGRWWRYSNDGGKNWSIPVQLSPPHVGTNGGVSFAIDSAETLHAFFGGRIDVSATHGIWHSVWGENDWSTPSAVVSGKRIIDKEGGDGFDPTFARSIVSNGNVVVVTWGTDGGAGSNGAWYSYNILDTTELPSVPLPVPPVIAPAVATQSLTTPTNIGDSKNGTEVLLENYGDSPQSPWNPQTSILLGVIPVILVLAGIILVHYLSRENK